MVKKGLRTEEIFSLDLVSSSQEELLAYLGKAVGGGKRFFIVTPNPEFVIASKKEPEFLAALNKADLRIPDGIGLLWAREVLKEKSFLGRLWQGILVGGKVLGGGIAREVISGVDLMEGLCQLAARKGWSVYLLGARPGVAKRALAVLKKRYPELSGWAESGPRIKTQDAKRKTQKWVKKINQKRPTLLFVAMGMGKQERFISSNFKSLKVKLAMGVGGAFDYLAGEVPRAPVWARSMGLEWFYRLLREPWRFKRQLVLLKFIWLTLAFG
jgi:N-acetylglucosaminyldiphosphoundecaprenol N-acetyl-beta-D-mannosaminyltransferase